VSLITAEDISIGVAEIGPVGYRRLTESQGARSRLYEVRNRGTWDDLRRFEDASTLPVGERRKKTVRASTAQREHVARLLRTGQSLTAQLNDTNEPTEVAMLGASLCDILDQLWKYRLAREDDWIEVLNLLQIVLRGESFETMSHAKRGALTELFQKHLTPRTIGSFELRGAVRLLKDAGFDIWHGIGTVTKG
jgi:hypothetical protein